MNPKLIIRYFIREMMGIAVVGAALFWPAHTFNWWQAWATLAVTLAWVIGTATVILIFNPALIAERLGPRPGAKAWDSVIMGTLGFAQLVRYILAGFDFRYHWTGNFPLVVQLIGLLIFILGYALFVWSIASNAFFTQIVRLQKERGQVVVTGGPYHFVRHPGYLGALLVEIGVPLLLSSWWALLVSVLTIFLLILRTALEDKALQSELAGYPEFAAKVKYRLFPWVW